MTRLEGGLHRLQADPSARADNQDCRHRVMLPGSPPFATQRSDLDPLALNELLTASAQLGGGLNIASQHHRAGGFFMFC